MENKSIYIQDDVIKDLEQDTFGHKHIAEAVLESIKFTKPPFTIGIFGGWGTGKSSLLELIKNKLINFMIILHKQTGALINQNYIMFKSALSRTVYRFLQQENWKLLQHC